MTARDWNPQATVMAAPQTLPAGQGWSEQTALLVLTHARNARYIPALRENLAMFWPNHPRLHVVTDGGLAGADVILRDERDFTRLLDHALTELDQRQPGCDRVYVMLEDLAPLGPVDERYLTRVEDVSRAKGLGYVCFHWQQSGRVEGLDPKAADVAPGLHLHALAPDAPSHNCLVVALWDLAHLRGTVAAKLASGKTDPWSFEHPLPEPAMTHYMVQDCWPTLRSGFLRRGQLTGHVETPDRFPPSPLLRQVRHDYRSSGPLTERMRRMFRRWERTLRLSLKRGVRNP